MAASLLRARLGRRGADSHEPRLQPPQLAAQACVHAACMCDAANAPAHSLTHLTCSSLPAGPHPPHTHTHTRVSHRCALTRPRRVAADGGPLANIQRQDHDLLSREPRRLREMEVERLELALSGVNL